MNSKRTFLLLSLLVIASLIGFHLARRSPEQPASDLTRASTNTPSIGVTASPVRPADMAVPGNPTRSEPVLFQIDSWTPQSIDLRPLAAGEPAANRFIYASGEVRHDSLPKLANLKPGDHIKLPLRDGEEVHGVVNLVQPDDEGTVLVGGGLTDSAKGSFSLGQRGGDFGGMIKVPATKKAYLISTSDQGRTTIVEKPLSSVQCEGTIKPEPDGVAAAQPPGTAPVAMAAASALTVPNLDSLPSASAVLYLDFDGEKVTDPGWNNGLTIDAHPAIVGTTYITAAQITDVFERVAEDFRPYNVAITTIRSRYDNAAVGHRMRIIVTNYYSYYYWAGSGSSGIAIVGSFHNAGKNGFTTTVPCWAAVNDNYSTADISGIISHELGHTLGLSHDSLFDSTDTTLVEEYYPGHGSWAPIMGTMYYHSISQWSKCEFAHGWNHDDSGHKFREDDLAIIGNATNGFGLRPDDASDAPDNFVLPNTGSFNQAGIISSASDTDVYTFSTSGGPTTITVIHAMVDPDLDVKLVLTDSTGTILQTELPTPALDATIKRTLAAGEYHIFVSGSGDGNPLDTGYSSYASIGAYTITGTFKPVPTLPAISMQPLSQNVAIGAKTVFSIVASSIIPFTYQWQKNNVNIPGATAATYIISSTQPSHQGTYTCVLTNAVGTKTSDPATLTVNFKPQITAQPHAITVGAGGSTPLTMGISAIGTPTLMYQWQKNNFNIPGANSDTFSISSPVFTDGGTYRCIVSNSFGSITSTGALAIVTSAPVITVPLPATKGVPLNGSATISITAVGTPTLLYQWYKNNVPIAGANKSSYTLSKITTTAAGMYRCDVKNTANSIVNVTTGSDCAVTVGIAPVVTTQPASTITVDTAASLNLFVIASGDPTLTYQWQHDGVNIGGATTSTLNIASAAWNDRGTYRCIVGNNFGSATSKNSIVTMRSAPIILSSTASRKLARGAKLTLSVNATGSPTLKYQWRKDSVNITSGGTAASLAITGTATATYDCIVTNTYGTATSTPALITIEDAPKITPLPPAQLAAIGKPYSYTATVSGSAMLTYQWKKESVILPTQTSNTLQITNLQATDAGTYTLGTTNDVGTVTSTAMKLTLQTAPSITLDPLSQTAFAFGNVTFTSAALGTASLKYQWLKDGNPITGATTNQLTLTSVQSGVHDGTYSIRVTNAVGSATSAGAMLAVTPVSSPAIAKFSPSQGNIGHYIRILGAGLNWTTAVQFQKPTTGVVNAPFVIISPTELLVTVPAGTATLSTLAVTTRGGSAVTSGSFHVLTVPSNDLFANARIISGTGGKISGTMPNSFSPEPGEPDHAYFGFNNPDFKATFSAWHSFTPTTSGTYIVSTAGSAFNTRMAVYTGSDVSSLIPIAANDNADSDNWLFYSATLFEGTAGTTYYIAIDGFDFTSSGVGLPVLEFGNYSLSVTRQAYSAPLMLSARSFATSGQVAARDTKTMLLGGAGNNTPALAWNSAPTSASEWRYKAIISFDAPPGSHDRCGFNAASALGVAQFGLNIDSDTGALSSMSSTGTLTFTGQTLLPGHSYELEVRIDNSKHLWGALLNGEWIIHDASWAIVGGAVTSLAAQWLAGPGNSHAILSITDASICTMSR